MSREAFIKEAADKYIDMCSTGTYCSADPKEAFIEGADFADAHPHTGLVDLSQVWHEAKEEPEEGTQVVAIDHDGWTVSGLFNPRAMVKGVYIYGDLVVDWYSVVSWAYIDDLLPKGGEQ